MKPDHDKFEIDPALMKHQNKFYKLMVEYLGEEVFVADGKGNVVFVNPASAKIIGLPVEQIVGRNAADLERDGYLSTSCTMTVLKQRKIVNMLQKLKDGRTVLATGVPIFDDDGEEIIMVISTSKDVDAVNELLAAVEDREKEIQIKNAEIEKLREDAFIEEGLISIDPSMSKIRSAILRIAPLEVTVLIEGETGVGKELVARALHRFSERNKKPFIKINCGIIPENLIESELFGYEAGAFTGASKEGKPGKVELADGGTLFLDEIGELPLPMQVKLLDFIQDGTFTRVGGIDKRKVDTRIIAATNRDLKSMSEQGFFRQDLYYRLNVIPLKIPPLRERPEDIGALAKYFISRYNTKYKAHKTLDRKAKDALNSYAWPGNVRELEHVLERIFIMADGSLIDESAVRSILFGSELLQEAGKVLCSDIMPLKEAKSEVERQLINRAYDMYKSTYKMAEALKIDQSTVVKLMQKHHRRRE